MLFDPSEYIDIVSNQVPQQMAVYDNNDIIKLERCIIDLKNRGIDLTSSYESWLEIGFSLSTLGEIGRYYFHEVSRMHPKYDYEEADKKYSNLIVSSNKRFTIATFYQRCKEHGVNIQNLKNIKVPQTESTTKISDVISADYARVGTSYFKKVQKTDKTGNKSFALEKWKKEAIIDDHGRTYLKGIPKYDTFCNIPSHLNYKQEVGNSLNTYQRLSHNIIEGNCNDTLGFLHHIFGTYYEIGLDYLTILFQKPTEKLPILCLVSKENGTGKTTFLKFLQVLFQNNCVVMGNNFFQMDFNSHYIQKLLICIDEGFIELDKPKEKEKIKQLATSDRQFIQYKGVDPIEIDYYGKLIMTSNDEERFVRIEKGETRWFVLKVQPFVTENPILLEAIIKEIPAFLHLLKTRNIFHPKTTRTWFAYNLITTSQMETVVAQSKQRFMRVIDEFLLECFDIFETNTLYFIVNDLVEEMRHLDKHLDGQQVKDYLKKLEIKNNKGWKTYLSLKIYNSINGEESTLVCPWMIKKSGLFYKINRTDIV